MCALHVLCTWFLLGFEIIEVVMICFRFEFLKK